MIKIPVIKKNKNKYNEIGAHKNIFHDQFEKSDGEW